MNRQYLGTLAERSAAQDLSARVLWPRTPIGDEIQERIRERVGAGDADVADPRSRPPRVVTALEGLHREGAIADDFSALDVACGDALVLFAIARHFPAACCHGIDINVGRFSAHEAAAAAGVELWRIPIQELVLAAVPEPFDVVLMLNTYRGWESADLRDAEGELPGQVDRWLEASARFLVLTMKDDQVEQWKRRGYVVEDLGPGEEDSRLLLLRRR